MRQAQPVKINLPAKSAVEGIVADYGEEGKEGEEEGCHLPVFTYRRLHHANWSLQEACKKQAGQRIQSRSSAPRDAALGLCHPAQAHGGRLRLRLEISFWAIASSRQHHGGWAGQGRAGRAQWSAGNSLDFSGPCLLLPINLEPKMCGTLRYISARLPKCLSVFIACSCSSFSYQAPWVSAYS